MDDAMKVSLVALAVARGCNNDQAWTIVDEVSALPTNDLRALTAEVGHRADAVAWSGSFLPTS